MTKEQFDNLSIGDKIKWRKNGSRPLHTTVVDIDRTAKKIRVNSHSWYPFREVDLDVKNVKNRIWK